MWGIVNVEFCKVLMKKDDDIFFGDTLSEAARVQLEILRKMDISERAEMTFELSDNLRLIVEEGIRHRHPDYTDDEVTQAVLSLTVDKEILKEAFGGREVSA